MRSIHVAASGVVAVALLAGAAPAQAAQVGAGERAATVSERPAETAAAKKSSKYKILKEFDYSRSKRYDLPLRLGEYRRNAKGKMVGFGWTKIKKKHNITKYGIIGWLAKSPNIDHLAGKRYNLTGWAHRVKCGPLSCKIVERRKMLLATDETMYAVGEGPRMAFLGAVTAFCVGSVKCPTWVNTKFKPKMSVASVNAAGSGEQYLFTYKPVKEQKGRLVLAG
ncbi:hypothetical protein GCM10009601_53700 [Streptomyces thermospinosisporus]|uniref:Uncharacterized protein n=1 Tax=Streptomyces thermospinosisporus TaxID=161482 RepID=A0ABP4JW12_9ACTN